ncbi:MAG: hypothetical protein EBR79_02680 [Proteobacteria bacterium]|nr:hypothetical protein [Pseudomonadota bacterium]NBX85698.1 hypothetical protein [Pseudomonadota bacterium]
MTLAQRNLTLALALGLFAVAVAASVFWWRFTHHLEPLPSGSAYGQTFAPQINSPQSTQPQTQE